MGCIYSPRRGFVLFSLILSLGLSGCVYNGPRATRAEIDAYRRELLAKAIRYRISLWKRVCSVGYRLITHIPKKFYQGSYPYLGFIVLDADDELRSAYYLPKGKCSVIVAKVDGTSAQNVDIEEGSVLLSLNNSFVSSYKTYKSILSQLTPGKYAELRLWNGREYLRYVRVDWRPVDVDFYMSSDAQINAAATSNAVVVTYGMMKFVRSDDELAVVLGHEIAHILLGHHAKVAGIDMVTGILGAVVGAKLEQMLPGLGTMVVDISRGAIEGGFSRELERQADYWGLYIAYRAGYDVEQGKDIWERFAIEVPDSMTTDFWRTHPTSVERRIYIEKIVNQFKQGIFPDNGDTAS